MRPRPRLPYIAAVERQPVLAVLGVADARQLVQEPEALVDEGVRREHVLIDRVGVHCPSCAGSMPLRPHRCRYAPRSSRVRRRRAHGREDGATTRTSPCRGRPRARPSPRALRRRGSCRGRFQDMGARVLEPGIEVALRVDDAAHDLRMELVRDGTVVRGVDTAKEPVSPRAATISM